MKIRFFRPLLLIIFVFFMIIDGASVQAQEVQSGTKHITAGRRCTLGFTIGTGADWMLVRSDSASRAGSVANLRYGVPIDINFTKASNYYFSTGLLFHHLGGKLQFENVNTDGKEPILYTNTRTYRSIYLTIPTAIKLKTPDFKNFVFGVNIGLYHSFRLSSRYVDQFTIANAKTTKKNNKYEKETAVFREAGFVGIGLEYIIKNDFRAYLYINYAYTFNNYFSKKTPLPSKEDSKLNSIEIVLGCTF